MGSKPSAHLLQYLKHDGRRFDESAVQARALEEMGRQQKELIRDAEVGKAIRDIKSPAAKRTVGVELMKRSVFLWNIV